MAKILILSSESLRQVTSLIWADHLPSLCLCFFSHKVEACISYLGLLQRSSNLILAEYLEGCPALSKHYIVYRIK